MRIGDQLSKDQKDKLNQIRKPKQSKKRNRTPKKKDEKVDWTDIMNTNNRGLRRKKGGAWSN